MTKSMTGFGKAQGEFEDKKITIEIRSLNSKQLDLNIRIPSAYREKEHELRSVLSKQVERGKVDLSISIESLGATKNISINKPLARNYYNELTALAQELNEVNVPAYLPLIIKMPDVFEREKQELNADEWEYIKTIIDKALGAFNQFREDEGKILAGEFENEVTTINQLLKEIQQLDLQRIPALKEKIQKNILEFVEKEKIDQNRFEQELIYYVEKIDITEEKVRLKTHCDYFIKTMQEESSGRKLGFISQEIGREINTIGSKANDATIQKLVVQMKDTLEKIKEQLLNVL